MPELLPDVRRGMAGRNWGTGMRVTFEVEPGKLFDALRDGGEMHNCGPIAADLLGVLMTGEQNFATAIRLKLSGIEFVEQPK